MERFTDFFGNTVYIADCHRAQNFRNMSFFQKTMYRGLNAAAFSTSPVIDHQLFHDWTHQHPPGNFALLDAHGNSDKNEWYYVDNRRKRPVQSWVNSVDGLYSVLFLMVCNPAGQSVSAEKSAVIHSVGLANIDDLYKSFNGRLYIPGMGYRYSGDSKISARLLHTTFSLLYELARPRFIDIE